MPTRARRSIAFKLLLGMLVLQVSLDVWYYHSASPPLSYRKMPPPWNGNDTLFVASTHWNNARLLRERWNNQILQLAQYTGEQNIFISVYESGSWDDSKVALKELEGMLEALNIPHKVQLDPTTHQDEISKPPIGPGWVYTSRNSMELRRIPYLSNLRNRSLEPLLALRANGTVFDKILFLNDIVFEVVDVATLLTTNNGIYAAACALDFMEAFKFYDTFATRDLEGNEAIMLSWPYFRSRQSRRALVAHKPVPVRSCWNSMVVMNTQPFYDDDHPLYFRGIPDSLAEFHLEGSECCLVHQDNPLTAEYGIWLNPSVRVGYSTKAYDMMKETDIPASMVVYMFRKWENRILRWFTTDWFKQNKVRSRLSSWRSAVYGKDRQEPGVHCLVDETQVLRDNGWAHV